MTPNSIQATRLQCAFQGIELRLQTLGDLGLAEVEQPPKVFSLLLVSTWWRHTHDLHLLAYRHNINLRGNSCTTNQTSEDFPGQRVYPK
jgi:hypothetical protein